MPEQEVYNIKNEQEMSNFADQVAKNSKIGDIFCLNGDLGAGKSFFARKFINSLTIKEIEVSSPTFNLLNIYEINDDLTIYHYDLYRLENEEELEELALRDAFINGITLIEWPKIAQNYLKKYINIDIEIKSQNHRLITMTPINQSF